MPTLSLIVLRAADVSRTMAFYERFGLSFVEEQHGTGPLHYSAQLGSTVLEIYPGKPGSAPDRRQAGATTLGFQVENVTVTVEEMKQQYGETVVLTAPQDSAWGRRAVVQDPDGRAVELNESASESGT